MARIAIQCAASAESPVRRSSSRTASANGPPPGTTTIALAPAHRADGRAHRLERAGHAEQPSADLDDDAGVMPCAMASASSQATAAAGAVRAALADPVGERHHFESRPARRLGRDEVAQSGHHRGAEPRVPRAHPPHARRRPSTTWASASARAIVRDRLLVQHLRGRRRPRARAARRRTRGSAGRPSGGDDAVVLGRPARRARGTRRRSARTLRRRAGRARPRAAPRGPPPRPVCGARRCRPALRSAGARDRSGPRRPARRPRSG